MSLKNAIESIHAEYEARILAAVRAASAADILDAFNAPALSVSKAPAAAKPVKRIAKHAPKPAAAKSAKPAKAAKQAKPAKAGGKRFRRPSGEVNAVADKVAVVVKEAGEGGLAISDIALKLAVNKTELLRPIQLAVGDGFIKKVGDRRSAKYVYNKPATA